MKTHTFNGRKYRIEQTGRIDGVTDVPCDEDDEQLTMLILDGDGLRSLHSAIHEAMHAHGIPDKYIHDKTGDFSTWDIARFIKRWIDERYG